MVYKYIYKYWFILVDPEDKIPSGLASWAVTEAVNEHLWMEFIDLIDDIYALFQWWSGDMNHIESQWSTPKISEV